MCRLGVKAQVFHLGDYRREALGGSPLPEDYFWLNPTESTILLRDRVMEMCRDDLLRFFNHENGQVGIYDAVNASSKQRHRMKELFCQNGIQTVFIESFCDNLEIIEQNVRSVKISSPDVTPTPLLSVN